MAHWTSWRRSPPFQGGETGSKPVCATKIASVAQLDRASAYEAEG